MSLADTRRRQQGASGADVAPIHDRASNAAGDARLCLRDARRPGLVAGPASGYRECWDFDTADDFDVFVAAATDSGLGDLVARIRAGYEDQTPGGTRRWLVRYPESIAWRDCTLAPRRPGRDGESKVKTLIELPTFAILAPSNGTTHPSGKPYVRIAGGFTTIADYSVEERESLFDLARSLDQMPRPEAGPVRERHRGADTRPGDDFAARTTWPEVLEPAGWTRVYDRAEVSCRRRPGKIAGHFGDDELRRRGFPLCLHELDAVRPQEELQPLRRVCRLAPRRRLCRGGACVGERRLRAPGGVWSNRPTGQTRSSRRQHPRPPRRGAGCAMLTASMCAGCGGPGSPSGRVTLWIGDGGLGKSRRKQ